MGNKRMFGICNAMCSSSASVSENLCGVLELAKEVGTIEKLWCIGLCSSRGPIITHCTSLSSWHPGMQMNLKGYKEEDTCCRTFSVLKGTPIKLPFQAVWFHCLLQCGDWEAMGGSFSGHFLLLLTTHWEWKPECLSQLCICNSVVFTHKIDMCITEMHMIHAEFVTQAWSESKIIYGNA